MGFIPHPPPQSLLSTDDITTSVLTLGVSRSNDYSDNLVSSPWKAILLTYVVVGNAKKFTTNQPMLTKPPMGFDSVQLMSLFPLTSFLTFQ